MMPPGSKGFRLAASSCLRSEVGEGLLALVSRLRTVQGVPAYPAPLAAPFPYFGGKRRAAATVWSLLGDPGGYVEPFAGSAAVLLARPPFEGRRTETLNDADGWLVNAWRSIQLDPAGVAGFAAGPVTEIDYHARLAWLHERRDDGLVSWLEGDPEAHDVKAAGWWLYVMACGIGDPFGGGPWKVIDGRLTDTRTLGDAGKGVNRGLPHLGNAGQGVNRGLPHLGNAGQGVRLAAYLGTLANRLASTRITCGSWTRVVTPTVTRAGATNKYRAVFLDPPYATSGNLYAHGDTGGAISSQVRAWCETADSALRIVLCGYDDEHDALLGSGWSKHEGRSGGGAGYSKNPRNGRRERLWASPACVPQKPAEGLFGT